MAAAGPISSPSIVGALACQKDSYLKSFETEVITCTEYIPVVEPAKNSKSQVRKKSTDPTKGISGQQERIWHVEFADSVLFPEGGGQPSDQGTITPLTSENPDSIPITYLQRHGLRCLAFSDREVPPGTKVRQDVDWSRRWDHMQQHTGQHLLSAIMDTMDLETLGWGMGSAGEMNYVELPRKPTDTEVRTIQDRCNEAIRNSSPITVETPSDAKADSLPGDYDKERGVVRFIRIGDLDYNACCGTHLKQTSHIQLILLHHTQSIRGTNCRLFFSCGERAINMATASISSIRSIAQSLSSAGAPSDVESSVQRLGDSLADIRKREKKLLSEIAKFESDRIKAELEAGSNAWCHRPNENLDFLIQILFDVKEFAKERAVVMVTGEASTSGSILIFGEKSVVGKLSAKVKEMVSTAKGGGKGDKWQGKVTEWKRGEIDVLEEAVKEQK